MKEQEYANQKNSLRDQFIQMFKDQNTDEIVYPEDAILDLYYYEEKTPTKLLSARLCDDMVVIHSQVVSSGVIENDDYTAFDNDEMEAILNLTPKK